MWAWAAIISHVSVQSGLFLFLQFILYDLLPGGKSTLEDEFGSFLITKYEISRTQILRSVQCWALPCRAAVWGRVLVLELTHYHCIVHPGCIMIKLWNVNTIKLTRGQTWWFIDDFMKWKDLQAGWLSSSYFEVNISKQRLKWLCMQQSTRDTSIAYV